MSTSSNEVMQKVDRMIGKDNFPNWIDRFLKNTFFNKCSNHNDKKKNELNRYCITCDVSACRHCTMHHHHNDHKILTIYKLLYKDVVPLNEMEAHMDCQDIQQYKCNKKLVVPLTPLPHEGSGLLIQDDKACYGCKRKLSDPQRFRFCSIVCKVQQNSEKSLIHFPTPKIGTSAKMEEVEQTKNNQSSRKRNRKGVSRRAALF